MICLSTHTVEEVFRAVDQSKKQDRFFGASLRCQRIMNFRLHGTRCVVCDLEGTLFVVEKHRSGDKSPHLNLYAARDNDQKTLMTRDHIRPLSKGGIDCIHNLQPMCSKCNGSKSNKWGSLYKTYHLISFIKHKFKGQCGCSFKKALGK